MEIEYTRCKECGYVYDESLGECPNCGAKSDILEDYVNEAIFNILD